MKAPESARGHDKRNWHRPATAIAGAALSMTVLSGCDWEFWASDAGHAAHNVEQSQAVRQDVLNQLRGIGVQAMKDYATGGGVDTALKTINLGHTLFINYVAPDGRQYSEDIEYTASEEEIQDGRITESQMNRIECIVEAPESLKSVQEGDTIFTKQLDDKWVGKQIINNLGTPNVCNYVESVLSPIENQDNQ